VESLRRLIAGSHRHTVAWVARDGAEAVTLCRSDRPDIILMDMIMPKMDGVEATRRIMQQSPCPILVVTASVSGHSSMVFEAMGAGALDAVATPVLSGKNLADSGADLLRKIDRIEKLCSVPDRKKSRQRRTDEDPAEFGNRNLVVIGASTGGPQVLVRILAPLPTDFDAAVIIIQHMDEKFIPGLAKWCGDQISLPVRTFRRGDLPERGQVLIACTDGHARMGHEGRLLYTSHPEDAFYHPSIDIFFESVARNWYGDCTGILLTGMGRDGAEGLLALRQRGFHTIAQEEKTCIVYGMPKYARAMDAARQVMAPQQIADFLQARYERHSR